LALLSLGLITEYSKYYTHEYKFLGFREQGAGSREQGAGSREQGAADLGTADLGTGKK